LPRSQRRLNIWEGWTESMPPRAKSMPKVKAAGEILKAFQAFDKNGDGTVSREELTALLQTLDKKAWTERKITALLRAVDKDHNGKIDYDEFVRWMMATASTDKDRKAVMSASELQSQPAAAASAEPAPGAEAAEKPVADAVGQAELDEVLDKLFAWYDEDGDGQIERIELLDGEERRIGKLEFGPKNRKDIIAWFKAAGAEGTPVDGMFLSKEKWRVAFVKSAAEEAGIDASAEPGKMAAWFRENRASLLEVPSPAPTSAVASGKAPEAGAVKEPPTYPVTCALKELQDKITEAVTFQRAVLVLSSGLDEVETFMKYRMSSTVDCKQIIGETLIKKSMSKEDAQANARKELMSAMNSSGFCKPLHVRLSNSAFDMNGFCCKDFPAEVFNPKIWTIESAFRQGFFDDGHKFALEVDDGNKWKDFYVIITSTFDLEKAKEHLTDRIPHFGELAIIVVDPASAS